MAELEKTGVFVSEKEIVRFRDHTRELSDDDARIRDALEKIYRDAGLAAPALSEAFEKAGIKSSDQRGRKLLQLLLDSATLVKVHGEMFFHRAALDELIRKLHSYAASTPERVIDVSAFKELAGVSRKYAIPLLEHFDRDRVTRREGDKRIIL